MSGKTYMDIHIVEKLCRHITRVKVHNLYLYVMFIDKAPTNQKRGAAHPLPLV
jgi:hypothetical protein